MKELKLKNSRRCETLSIRADEKRDNVLWFTIATERQASDGGILIADGMDAKTFNERPFVLFMHDPTAPIGRCVELVRTKEGWDAAVEIAPDDKMAPSAATYLRFLKWAGFGAASIGFRCNEIDWEPKAEELAKYSATGRGWIGRKWTLLEWSLVTLPADMGAGMHSDPFMAVTDADERRAIKTTMAMVGVRMSTTQTTNDIPGGTMPTATSGTTTSVAVAANVTREADPVLVESLARVESMLTSTNEKLDGLIATVNQMAEANDDEDEAEETEKEFTDPAPEAGSKADQNFVKRLKALGLV